MFLHREADTRVTAVKAHFPYYFSSTMFRAHGTGSPDFLLIPCSQRKDQGDPRLSSSWPVSSMAQMKILNFTQGWSPAQVSTLILPDFIRNALLLWLSFLLLSQKALLFPTPAMYRLDFSVERCRVSHGTETKQEKNGNGFCWRG